MNDILESEYYLLEELNFSLVSSSHELERSMFKCSHLMFEHWCRLCTIPIVSSLSNISPLHSSIHAKENTPHTHRERERERERDMYG